MADHAIVRTDNMFGTDNRSGLVSIEYMGSDGKTPTDIDNGNVLKIGALKDGEREIYVGSAPAAGDKIEDVVLVATPEVSYRRAEEWIGDFYNKAGIPARGYIMHSGSTFSVTADALDGTPAVGNVVAFAGGTKLSAAASDENAIGSIIAVEVVKNITFYVIRIK